MAGLGARCQNAVRGRVGPVDAPGVRCRVLADWVRSSGEAQGALFRPESSAANTSLSEGARLRVSGRCQAGEGLHSEVAARATIQAYGPEYTKPAQYTGSA